MSATAVHATTERIATARFAGRGLVTRIVQGERFLPDATRRRRRPVASDRRICASHAATTRPTALRRSSPGCSRAAYVQSSALRTGAKIVEGSPGTSPTRCVMSSTSCEDRTARDQREQVETHEERWKDNAAPNTHAACATSRHTITPTPRERVRRHSRGVRDQDPLRRRAWSESNHRPLLLRGTLYSFV